MKRLARRIVRTLVEWAMEDVHRIRQRQFEAQMNATLRSISSNADRRRLERERNQFQR